MAISLTDLLISIAAKKFLAEIMGAPVRNDTALGTYTSLVVGGAAVLFFLLRVIARLPYFGGNWGLDDWVMTVAVVNNESKNLVLVTG